MRSNNDTRKKRFLALLLSALMVSSTAAFAACNADDDSSSSSSSSSTEEVTKADNAPIKNGGFETFDKKDGKNLIGTSVSSWTRSVNSAASGSALSSKSASGIIDTTAEAWEELTTTGLTDKKPEDLTEDEAKANWSKMTAADKLKYYEAWEDANDDDDKDVEDLEFYESFNIDSEDLPDCDNPLTHDYNPTITDVKDVENKNVLMIHNEYSNSTTVNKGTAQKYTSSSTITVKAGTSAKFSVWVKTADLQSPTEKDEDELPAVGNGAYISITHSVGSKSLDPLIIKNIDTSDIAVDAANNWGWEKYEFVLQGASFADTTFTIVLGLGQGGGTDTFEYVNGYAFFDDAVCETISNAAYETEASGLSAFTAASTAKQKTIDAYTNDDKKFALDFYGEFATSTNALASVSGEYTTEKGNTGEFTSIANPTGNLQTYQGLGFDTTYDVKQVFATPSAIETFATTNNNNLLKAIYTDHFKDNVLYKNVLTKADGSADVDAQKTLLLYSADGAAMTANAPTVYTVGAGKYLAISFFLKTSDMDGVTGAGITLKETTGTNKAAFENLDVSSATTVDINEETKDIYGGWQQCFFFVQNDTNDALSFTLSFNLGPKNIIGTTKASYTEGFAAFTGFKTKQMDEAEFNCISSGTYTKTVSLVGKDKASVGSTIFDSAAGVPTDAIKKGFADPKNYKGIYSNSEYLGGNGGAEINTNENAGLLSKEYVQLTDEDTGVTSENTAYSAILQKLGATGSYDAQNPYAVWDNVFGGTPYNVPTTQPLVIYNEGAQTHSYGFIGNSTSLTASSPTQISLLVKVGGNTSAKAYVHLISTEEDTFGEALSVSRNRTYWYNDDGDVCVEDPAKNDKSSNIALKLQENGLYKINPAWSGAGALTDAQKNSYYANLAAYERKSDGETVNLMMANGAVSYDYNESWRNDGNDGIAFYNYNETKNAAYAYSTNQTDENLVYDFSTLVDGSNNALVTPRYEAKTSEALSFEVGYTGDKWALVSFYIYMGDTAKSYRLEVWSGDREGLNPNPAGSFVAFNTLNYGSLTEENYNLLLDAQEKDLDVETNHYFKGVYSFYDTDSYLRYDATLDENDVGDSYTAYLSSKYSDKVTYLKYADTTTLEQGIFANYSVTETVETPTTNTDDDDDDGDDDDTTGTPTNVWLLASSIAIAAVLLLAVVSLIVRKLWARARRRRGVQTLVKTEKAKKEKKTKKSAKKNEDNQD